MSIKEYFDSRYILTEEEQKIIDQINKIKENVAKQTELIQRIEIEIYRRFVVSREKKS